LKLSKLLVPAIAFLFASTTSHAALLTMGFDDITTLTGGGWVQINNSMTPVLTSWFQGNSTFPAQAGPIDSFIAANFNNAAFGGDISNWLLLPLLTLNNGDTLTFWTRTEASPAAGGDTLEVRLAPGGASTNVGATTSSVGDFTQLLSPTIGTLTNTDYPQAWTLETYTVSGLSGPTSTRLALRYVVVNTANFGDFIGIDTLSVDSSVTSPVPEPSTVLLLGAGIAMLAIQRTRKRV
jgi:PEP-CTERM motif